MISQFRRIVDDVRNGDNIENYIIILLALIIVILDIFNFASTDIISEITLAVLALIAFGRITDQRRIEEINIKISQISQSRFLNKYPESLVEDMRTTPELWIFGITLSRTINNHYILFKQKLEQGANIKILLVTPGSPATDMAAFRDRRERTQKVYDDAARQNLRDFCKLREQTNGNLEFRTINLLLSFGYYAMEPDATNGRIYVEHYAFKSEAGDVPKMLLTQTDGYVYEAYCAQLHRLWDQASEWQCDSSIP